MKTTSNRHRILGCVLLVVLFGMQAASGQPVPAKAVMQQKLAHSQAVLAAVVTSDWPTLGRESRALLALTKDPAWVALVTPDTRHRTDAFVLALQDLIGSADRQNLDDAVMAEVSMNLQCVRCHQLMARQKRGH
jgi:hypothetical protein